MATATDGVAVSNQARSSHSGVVKAKLGSLTGLRFLAAMAVVFRHFSALGAFSLIIQRVVSHGFVAVSFFFVLSGFVLTYSYSDGEGAFRGTLKAFYWSRLARIYPAYLLATVASILPFYWLLHGAHGVAGATARAVGGGVMVAGLVQSWLPWTVGYVNSPAWSLSVEAFFYLMFPFILARLRGLSRPQIIQLWVLFWVVAIVPPWIAWIVKEPQPGTILYALIQCLPILRLPEFLMGCLTARLFLLSKPSPGIGSWASWLCCALIFLVLGSPVNVPELILGNGLLSPLFCLLIWFASSAKGIFKVLFAAPIFVFLGEISYSIYILQEPIARWYERLSGSSPQAFFGPFLLVLLALSAGCFCFVELPIGRWIRATAIRRA
jgi:peptidoglycan/LPS O-acetylase OafA/YrhL